MCMLNGEVKQRKIGENTAIAAFKAVRVRTSKGASVFGPLVRDSVRWTPYTAYTAHIKPVLTPKVKDYYTGRLTKQPSPRVGFHAYKTADAAFKDGARVLVKVLLWGSVVEHRNGYRAEYMKILA